MEGDAGSGQLTPNPPTSEDSDDEIVESEAKTVDETEAAVDQQPRGSRLAGRRVVAVCAALVITSLLIATGGYFALRAHQKSASAAQTETLALAAAKDCVAATQAPDAAAMAASQQKIVDCWDSDLAAQAPLYSSLLIEAYQAANVQLKVSNMRAAVERHNPDGSMDILVAVRVKMSNSQSQDQEQSYRLRVRMMPEGGTYKIARLDQVARLPGDGDGPRS
ncbi:Mce protein [Mycolicibacterium sp. Dal123E01]|uniref:Mce protein n=1 Tax=Mycolicibacterium sp. Dal123E01 TaxID=3457578 RepID=UPI00403EAA17